MTIFTNANGKIITIGLDQTTSTVVEPEKEDFWEISIKNHHCCCRQILVFGPYLREENIMYEEYDEDYL